jgi:hypothetical protein
LLFKNLVPTAEPFSECLTLTTVSPQSIPFSVAMFPSMTGPDADPTDSPALAPFERSDLAADFECPPPEELAVLTWLPRRDLHAGDSGGCVEEELGETPPPPPEETSRLGRKRCL